MERQAFRNTTYLGTRSPVNNAVSDVATVESITGVAFASERVAWAVGWGNFVSLGVIYRGVCRW
jgi:hypothetical protein